MMTPTRIHKSLMITDDDADDRHIIEYAVNEHFILDHIATASNGADMLDQLYSGIPSNRLPDLILLDINMPKVSGLEALEEIKLHPELKHIPVVMLTTSASRADIRKAYDTGASGFILKPNSLAELVYTIKQTGIYWFMQVQLAR
jgi:two-component system response regulator